MRGVLTSAIQNGKSVYTRGILARSLGHPDGEVRWDAGFVLADGGHWFEYCPHRDED